MIQKLYKVFKISASHVLNLPYDSKCNNLHGHNYKIEIHLGGFLNSLNMIMDFSKLSKIVKKFDHKHLNEELGFDTLNSKIVQPTAEIFSMRICRDIINSIDDEEIGGVQVRVWETDNCYAETFVEHKEFIKLSEAYQLNAGKPQFNEVIAQDPTVTQNFSLNKLKEDIEKQTGDTNKNKRNI